MSLVLDSSVTLAWLYSDEITDTVSQVFETVEKTGAWVPSLWRLEVANSLQMSMRRKRIDSHFRDASLADLALLNIAVDPETDAHAWSASLRLSERFHLTVYDAAYLELAQRRNLPLASLDHDLCRAAMASGTQIIGMKE